MELESWQQSTKKHFMGGDTLKVLFQPYKKEKPPAKIIPWPTTPKPDYTILEMYKVDNYLDFTKAHLDYSNLEEYTLILVQQDKGLTKPLNKNYPKHAYQTFYKDAFNAILKIGTQKNTTKKLH